MDARRFGSDRTGTLVRLDHPVRDWAFVPDPLPPAWRPSAATLRLLVEAAQAIGQLDGAGRLIANPELLLRPLRRREALKSSSLEGTYATSEELLLFELSGRAAAREGGDSVVEVHNYGAALELGMEMRAELPFCLRLIREVHARLLRGVRGRDQRPGEFRRSQVHIGSDRRFVPAPPDRLDELLGALEQAMNARPDDMPPLIWCFLVHYQFECIHPFNDGNGRVGRLLLSLMIADQAGLSKPWLYLSAWFDTYKDEYIDLMFNVSARGAWEEWVDYCLRGTLHQARDTVARLDRLIELRERYLGLISESGGSARLVKIVDGLFAHRPATTIPNLASELEVTYPTAKKDVERLVELGIVVEHPTLHPRTFVGWEIVQVGVGEDA